MKKIIFTVVCTLLYSVILCSCKDKSYFRGWEQEYFGEEIYSELDESCSEEDRAEFQPLLDKIEQAFSSIYDNPEKAEEEWGFYLYRYTHHDIKTITEEHNVEFLTGKVSGDNAYFWIEYWSTGYDYWGNPTDGSGSEEYPNRVRFTAEKQNGEWVITDCMEHP